MFYKIIVLLSALLFSSCAYPNKISYSSPYALQRATKSVVQITIKYSVKKGSVVKNKTYFATGFSIKRGRGESYILTNQHVCNMRGNAIYILRLESGYNVRATYVRVDKIADLCLLKTYAIVKPLALAPYNSERGERITTIGAPDGVYPIIVDGITSGYLHIEMGNNVGDDGEYDVNFRAQLTSVPVYPGSSGSPVLNTDGEVVGIVFAVRDDKEHISFIVPASEINRFMNLSDHVYDVYSPEE